MNISFFLQIFYNTAESLPAGCSAPESGRLRGSLVSLPLNLTFRVILNSWVLLKASELVSGTEGEEVGDACCDFYTIFYYFEYI